MYQPAFTLSQTGVPILSKAQMDRIAGKCIREFIPEMLQSFMPLPVDEFCEVHQKLNVEYQHLSNNGCYLGMAVFGEQVRIPLYEPETDSIRYAHFGPRTILLESSLLEEERENKLRFTAMHECAHQILHANYFRLQEAQADKQRILCRQETIERNNMKPYSEWTDIDRMEWQANYLAAALLMPVPAVRDCMRVYQIREYYEARVREGMYEERAFNKAALDLSYVFHVSTITAKIRLTGLDFARLRNAV